MIICKQTFTQQIGDENTNDNRKKVTKMTQPSYYEILGINKTATKEEIKKAFRECSKHYHPDANRTPNAALIFRMINEARNVLLDDEKRAKHDESLGFNLNP